MAAWNPLSDKQFVRNLRNVAFGEGFSTLGALIISPATDKLLLQNDNFIRKKVTEGIEPHVQRIEKSSFHRMLHVLGEEEGESKELSYHSLSIHGRAQRIADILIKGIVLFVSDNFLSTATQFALEKREEIQKRKQGIPNADKPTALWNGLIGATTHLLCIGLFGTVLEKPTEWAYRKLAVILQKTTGMQEDKALRAASGMVIIAGPGLVSALAQVFAGGWIKHGR